ncbi:MAG: DUF3592 domain-containing protein [Solirubrobacterales bacterium]
MDKMKDAANQASKATGMGTGMGVGDQVAYRNKAMKINESGVNTPATVKSATESGNSDVGGSSEFQFEVELRPEGGSPYSATFTQFMAKGSMRDIAAGSEITVRVDPDDPNSMMFWGLPG